MYIRKVNAMKLEFTFRMVQKVAEETALLDSGASENFLDKRVWEGLGIGRVRLERPIPVHNVDRTENQNGEIQYYCWLKVRLGGRSEKMRFYLTNLGKDRFILGYPFLWEFNPQIDWKTGQLLKGNVEIKTVRFGHVQRLVTKVQGQA